MDDMDMRVHSGGIGGRGYDSMSGMDSVRTREVELRILFAEGWKVLRLITRWVVRKYR